MIDATEVNFDGIVGPTHNYSGLSFGNVASMSSQSSISSPKKAALQGLRKMHFLASLGLGQGVLPPHERPNVAFLRSLGFGGSNAAVLAAAHKYHKHLFSASISSSNMWAANAATVCPSVDSVDSKVHFTAANLCTTLHRSIEAEQTALVLRTIFADDRYFQHHDPLPNHRLLSDEGAANHTRFCREYGEKGVHFFVYGQQEGNGEAKSPTRFPARQAYEASQAVARLHTVPDEQFICAQQNPSVIDAGAFHNDVVAVGNKNVLFYYEPAFVDNEKILKSLRDHFAKICQAEFKTICVSEKKLNSSDVVNSYLFNSQLICVDKDMLLICPSEAQENTKVADVIDEIIADAHNPIKAAHFLDLRESMKNGGGPACLRLRVVLTAEEKNALGGPVLLTDALFAQLCTWIEKHYRDELSENELADPQLLYESDRALDELTQLLALGSIYSFQRT